MITELMVYIKRLKKKYTQNGHGKINWKRTLSSTPYYVDDNPIFINPYYETNTYKNNIDKSHT